MTKSNELATADVLFVLNDRKMYINEKKLYINSIEFLYKLGYYEDGTNTSIFA